MSALGQNSLAFDTGAVHLHQTHCFCSRRLPIVRQCGSVSILLVFGTGSALGQVTANQRPIAPAIATAVVTLQPAGPDWSLSASVNAYFPGDSQNYVQPTISADTDRLHLEARYNYEALDAGSAWVGYNFSTGENLQLDFTAMVGGVFGQTHGYAPGYELTLSWHKVQLYSEGEYVFDTGNSADSFFYTWSELTLAPAAWFQCGLVIQRTQAYQTDLEIQRGFLVRFTYKKVDLSAYVFNPDEAKPTYVLAAGVDF